MSELDRGVEAWKRELELAHSLMQSFGAKIKATATDREVSVRKLAGNLGIEHTRLHRITKGDLLPSEAEMSTLLDWMYHDGGATLNQDKEAG